MRNLRGGAAPQRAKCHHCRQRPPKTYIRNCQSSISRYVCQCQRLYKMRAMVAEENRHHLGLPRTCQNHGVCKVLHSRQKPPTRHIYQRTNVAVTSGEPNTWKKCQGDQTPRCIASSMKPTELVIDGVDIHTSGSDRTEKPETCDCPSCTAGGSGRRGLYSQRPNASIKYTPDHCLYNTTQFRGSRSPH